MDLVLIDYVTSGCLGLKTKDDFLLRSTLCVPLSKTEKQNKNEKSKMNGQACNGHQLWSQMWQASCFIVLVLPPSSGSVTLVKLQVPHL